MVQILNPKKQIPNKSKYQKSKRIRVATAMQGVASEPPIGHGRNRRPVPRMSSMRSK
jgi:hypothetical protein